MVLAALSLPVLLCVVRWLQDKAKLRLEVLDREQDKVGKRFKEHKLPWDDKIFKAARASITVPVLVYGQTAAKEITALLKPGPAKLATANRTRATELVRGTCVTLHEWLLDLPEAWWQLHRTTEAFLLRRHRSVNCIATVP
jgi:hypothetical protein